MKLKIEKVVEFLINNPISSQRAISKELNYSLGSVNSIIKTLVEDNFVTIKDHSYRKKEYIVSREAINRYIKNNTPLSAIILCGGSNEVDGTPTPLLEMDGISILERQIQILNRSSIDNIILVIGEDNTLYRELEKKYKLTTIQNREFKTTGSMYSLALAKEYIKSDTIIVEGDLIFDSNAIETIKNSPFKNCTISTELSSNSSKVYLSLDSNKVIVRVSKDENSLTSIDGELLGITKLTKGLVNSIIEKSIEFENNRLFYEYLFEESICNSKINALYIPELKWCDVDNREQYDLAKKIITEIT